MDILEATHSYEQWLRSQFAVDEHDLRHKHWQMAKRRGLYRFFRGTYYRWAQHWRERHETAPQVLSIGDAHVENFGAWRDVESRLCWGVNDFDEVDTFPYTQDLIRLAVSFWMARRFKSFSIRFGKFCSQILQGYRHSLEHGGIPFVLEESNLHLRAIAMNIGRNPRHFWKKTTSILEMPVASWDSPSPEVVELLERELPDGATEVHIRPHREVGMGSLGKPRFIALAKHAGSWVAREAKRATAPIASWLDGVAQSSQAMTLLSIAKRSRDPYYQIKGEWYVRRLAPRCSRIKLSELKSSQKLELVAHSMGAEVANIHLGTKGAEAAIISDLDRRPSDWLTTASRELCEKIVLDFRRWRKHKSGSHRLEQ